MLMSVRSIELQGLVPHSHGSSADAAEYHVLHPDQSDFRAADISPTSGILDDFFDPNLSSFMPLVLSSGVDSRPTRSDTLHYGSMF